MKIVEYWTGKGKYVRLEDAEAAIKAAVAAERAKFPDLMHVILWLENGCDPKEAAKELRIYQARGAAHE